MFNPSTRNICLMPALVQDQETEFHRNLLLDGERTDRFRDAIRAVVRQGDLVADIGAGTGILSMFAVQAGASHVYAIESKPIALAARAAAVANGMADRITIIHNDSFRVTLPAPVNVIVSECIGWMMYVGTMFAAVADARDRMLLPGGTVIPRRVRLFAAPVEAAEQHHYAEVFRASSLYGLDLSSLRRSDQVFTTAFRRESVLSEPRLVAEADVIGGYPPESLNQAAAFRIERDGVFHGLGLWFEADLCDGVILSTAPGSPHTIWQQTFLSCGPGISVAKDSSIDVTLMLWRSVVTLRQSLSWNVTVRAPNARDPIVSRQFSTLGPAAADPREWVCTLNGGDWLDTIRTRATSERGKPRMKTRRFGKWLRSFRPDRT